MDVMHQMKNTKKNIVRKNNMRIVTIILTKIMIIQGTIQDFHKKTKEVVFVVYPKIIFWIHVL